MSIRSTVFTTKDYVASNNWPSLGAKAGCTVAVPRRARSELVPMSLVMNTAMRIKTTIVGQDTSAQT